MYVLLISSAACSANLSEIITRAEQRYEIPKGLLHAIAMVESKMKPYAVNRSKKTYHFSTKKEAKEFIEKSIKNGQRNISIGCLQLLYNAHKRNFGNSIDNMLDPEKNVNYAAKYLKLLYSKTGSWEKAVKRYHSCISSRASKYYKNVMKILNV
ncbi:MAG: transglycosylase SLT domain-containing protein [Holosporales bacterium]|jgi:soluble lytic murein transglycosylase-like protein|nr:transglycosylase SLT domain-containing protein [Holosporales bacterium]